MLLIELRQLLDVVDADMTDAALVDAAGDTPRWREDDADKPGPSGEGAWTWAYGEGEA